MKKYKVLDRNRLESLLVDNYKFTKSEIFTFMFERTYIIGDADIIFNVFVFSDDLVQVEIKLSGKLHGEDIGDLASINEIYKSMLLVLTEFDCIKEITKTYKYRVVQHDNVLEEGTIDYITGDEFDPIIDKYMDGRKSYYCRMIEKEGGWIEMDFGSYTIFIEYKEV